LSPPQNYLSILDLCQKAAFTIQDNQALQYTGNQYFNYGSAFQKAGKRKEAKIVLERSLELDFSPIVSKEADHHEQSEEDKKRAMTVRCRKLEMLGECCAKGEEKDAFALILESMNIQIETLDLATDVAFMSLGQLMKKDEYLTRLIGCLDDEFELTINDTTPPEVKAFVYEVQVHILLGMTHKGRDMSARNIAQKALDIYTQTQCPLRRLRVIERLLYLAIMGGGDVEDLLALASEAISTLTAAKVLW
jgi:tetratricopeptide (TPR) repeat protein